MNIWEKQYGLANWVIFGIIALLLKINLCSCLRSLCWLLPTRAYCIVAYVTPTVKHIEIMVVVWSTTLHRQLRTLVKGRNEHKVFLLSQMAAIVLSKFIKVGSFTYSLTKGLMVLNNTPVILVSPHPNFTHTPVACVYRTHCLTTIMLLCTTLLHCCHFDLPFKFVTMLRHTYITHRWAQVRIF